MKGIIWYINKSAGQAECEQIIHNYQRNKIEVVKKITSGGNQQILFSNGDIWKTCYANDSARGNCCNISLIEKNISKRIIDTIIVPCTKALPYTAFKYYNFDEYSLYEQLLQQELKNLNATQEELALVNDILIKNAILNHREPKDVAWTIVQ